MAAPIQQVPIPNGNIPIVPGAAVQPTLFYQQQPIVMAAGGQQVHYAPRKPYIPRERNPQEEQCKIFVGAVGKNTSEETLRNYFSKFGEIADSVIMMNKQTGEPRGFAFVTFKNADAVHAVIEQCNNGGHTLDGKMYLQVRKYFPKAEYDAEKASNPAGIPNIPGGAQFQYKGPMKVSPELKIFVGGIGIGTTEDDVKTYFSNYGKVLAVNMPRDFNTKNPRGFAFVGFENTESVMAVTKDRYHQINGKTVEVKGADEQQQHQFKKRESMQVYGRGAGPKFGVAAQPGTIATVSGYGAYASFGAAPQQVIVPQNAAGVSPYATVQVPAAATGGFVFDPSTNTYYQLPGTVIGGAGGLAALGAGGVVSSSVAGAAANPYAGIGVLGGAAGAQQVLAAQQVQRHGGVTADMMAGLGGSIAIGSVYSNETSTFGPQRAHVLGGGGQQPIAISNTVADPHVVYSNSTSISAGDVAISSRGFHPYGR